VSSSQMTYFAPGDYIWGSNNYIGEYTYLGFSSLYGSHFCISRINGLSVHSSKIIILGSLCDGNSNAPLDDLPWFDKPAAFEPEKPGDFVEFEGPTFEQCGLVIATTDLNYEFYDVSPELTTAMLDWVSIDKSTNTIRVTATIESFQAYQQQTMYVGIRVLTNSVPAVVNR